MLSDEEKQEMLADARDQSRRESFAFAEQLSQERRLSGQEFVQFLTSIQKLSMRPAFKRIEGSNFKL